MKATALNKNSNDKNKLKEKVCFCDTAAGYEEDPHDGHCNGK